MVDQTHPVRELFSRDASVPQSYRVQEREWMVAFNELIGTGDWTNISDTMILRATWEVYDRVQKGKGITWERMQKRGADYYTGSWLRQSFIISYLYWTVACEEPSGTKEHSRLLSAYQLLSANIFRNRREMSTDFYYSVAIQSIAMYIMHTPPPSIHTVPRYLCPLALG
jgi:hypothetical protein